MYELLEITNEDGFIHCECSHPVADGTILFSTTEPKALHEAMNQIQRLLPGIRWAGNLCNKYPWTVSLLRRSDL